MSGIAKLVIGVSILGFTFGLGTLTLVRRHRKVEQQKTAKTTWDHLSQLQKDALRRDVGEPLSDDDAPLLPEPDPALVYQIDIESSPQRGPVTAPITIVLFGDFQSQASRDVDAAVSQVLSKYPGELRVVWKNLTVGRGASAERAAILGLVADDYQKFWSLHDDLLGGKADPLTDEKLIGLGQKAGLSGETIRAAWSDPVRRKRLLEDRYQARRFGIHRGPVLFVNGRFAKSPIAAPALAALIDDTKQLANIMLSDGMAPEKIYWKLMRGAIPNTAPLGQQASATP